jgi:signal transduction histidine kinase
MLVRGGGAAKIHAGVQDSNSDLSAAPPSTAPSSTQRMCTADGESARDAAPDAYIWVESAMCKGMRLTTSGDFEYDVKMVTRNIDERKKQAQNQLEMIVRASEEQAHINAAKLRYISCIAHDLKTPLQSFCFSLDLLQQTPMLDEQRELVQQANTAVDLMKLTISQTMDISKTLSGGKIVPRCTTVLLSSVMQRVQVIM